MSKMKWTLLLCAAIMMQLDAKKYDVAIDEVSVQENIVPAPKSVTSKPTSKPGLPAQRSVGEVGSPVEGPVKKQIKKTPAKTPKKAEKTKPAQQKKAPEKPKAAAPVIEHKKATRAQVREHEKVMENVFEGKSGFKKLSDAEKKKFEECKGESKEACKGDHTYGEILYDSAQTILDAMKLTPADTFVDMGSGIGKFVVQARLNTAVGRAVGYELADSRYENAQLALKRFKDEGYINKNDDSIQFYHQDFLKADLRDATVIFMCATCFEEPIMRELVKKFSKLNPGLIVITLKELPDFENYGFRQLDTTTVLDSATLPMTWSEGSPIYIYMLMD